MYERLLKQLNHLVPLKSQQQDHLSRVLKPVEIGKDDLLLEKGEICHQIYFVESGVLRSFYEVGDRQITRWFGFPGHFATSYFSFVYQQPSEDSIIAATPCHLCSISAQSLQSLCQQDSVWLDLHRRLLEYYYTALLERVMSLQTQSTAERYEHLLQEYPEIEQQVALGHLASYLGMTPETFSRLRARRKRRQQKR